MNFPVFDLHCDTAFAMLGNHSAEAQGLLQNTLHFDLERAGKFPGFAQCFACFTTDLYPGDPVVTFQKELDQIRSQLAQNSDRIRQAYGPAEIMDNFNHGHISAILTIEGPAGFRFDPERLGELAEIGFRMTTLGWNEENPLTGSHVTGGGLTDLGRAYVRRAQDLNMLVDVSHISDTGFWNIIHMTKDPVVASHSNSRALCDVSRNLTDDMFRAICETGGVVGINLYAGFLGEDPDLDTVCAHILHFLELDPSGKHIALGGDLDGCDQLPSGFTGVEDYSELARLLLRYGLDHTMVEDIFWNNALGVMKRCYM